jgi:pyridoxal phosphate enzyme (YggS family)
MKTLAERHHHLLQRIAAAAHKAGRQADQIQLLAVSKKHPISTIETLMQSGQLAFGENYVDEALEKIRQLTGLGLEWHYIGPVQSNKTRAIAEHFDWVQSIDRLKIARRLSEQRPPELGPLQCLVQVRIGGEAGKSGCEPEAVFELVGQIADMPRLRLRGLMSIPPPSGDLRQQRAWFAQLRELYDQLRRQGFELDTLSMGMTDDLESAIAEGATLVRIGTALFGPRPS